VVCQVEDEKLRIWLIIDNLDINKLISQRTGFYVHKLWIAFHYPE